MGSRAVSREPAAFQRAERNFARGSIFAPGSQPLSSAVPGAPLAAASPRAFPPCPAPRVAEGGTAPFPELPV